MLVASDWIPYHGVAFPQGIPPQVPRENLAIILVPPQSKAKVFQDLLSWPTCLDLPEAIMSTQGSNHAISLQRALVQ